MFFKKTALICFLLLLRINCSDAQVHSITHCINASIGVFADKTINNVEDDSYSGMGSYKLGYVVSYCINHKWSLETGISIIHDDKSILAEEPISKDERKKYDKFGFLHLPLVVQYNIGKDPINRNHWSVGLGPSLNITLLNDTYEYKNSKMQMLNGRNKLKTFNIGIQTNVSFTFHKKYSFSLDCNFGLLNMKKNYNIGTGKKYFYHFWPTFSYQF